MKFIKFRFWIAVVLFGILLSFPDSVVPSLKALKFKKALIIKKAVKAGVLYYLKSQGGGGGGGGGKKGGGGGGGWGNTHRSGYGDDGEGQNYYVYVHEAGGYGSGADSGGGGWQSSYRR